MKVHVYIGMSIDGFIAASDGTPAWEGLRRPGTVDTDMYGYDRFMREISAVVMGRTTYDGCVEFFGSEWPWKDKQVFVLTSRPLAVNPPAGVTAWHDGAAALLGNLKTLHMPGDVKLMGGAKAIQSFREVGAIDRFDVYVIPVLLGEGIPLSPPGSPPLELRLNSQTVFPNGAIKLVYSPLKSGSVEHVARKSA